MTVREGVLVWPYFPMCDLDTDYPRLSEPQKALAVSLAVEWLWARSGRRFGTRAVTYRPQSRIRGYAYGLPGVGLQPVGGALTYYGYGCGGGDREGPEQDQYLELDGPVASVEAVTIAGAPVDPGVWRQEGNYLVRQDGGVWPRNQNMIAPDGAANTWSISYTRGYPVTDFGQYATGKLICHFAKQLSTNRPCTLPENTKSVGRVGVTIERDPKGAGQTSPVPEVDQWLRMVNPNGLASEPVVWSPDLRRRQRPFAGSYEWQTDTAPVGQPSTTAFLVLGDTDPVPAGTPVGTVILRTQPN